MEKERKSNIELFRIILMLLIIGHHYVVSLSVSDYIYGNPFTIKNVTLLFMGAWGKTAINCFILITGYYMCKKNINLEKFLKLLFEVIFYNIVIFIVLFLFNKTTFSISNLLNLLPISSIDTDFVGCFLVFYLLIPFINVLISKINKKQFQKLLLLLLFIYVFFGTVPIIYVSMNYVSWFIVVYMIGSYLRLYPIKFFENRKKVLITLLSNLFIVLISICICAYLSKKFSVRGGFYLVAESNMFFPLVISVLLFSLFMNININNNKFINTISKSVFGVLLLHTNSDDLRKVIWDDIFKVGKYVQSNYWFLHFVCTVIVIFCVGIIVDYIRIHLIEEKVFKKLKKNKYYQKIIEIG